MAEIVRVTPSPVASMLLPPAHRIAFDAAGEDLADCDAVYIKSDGKPWKATGAAATAPSLAVGIVGFAKAGEPCTVIFGTTVRYSTGMIPGTRLYVSGTVPGGLADAASTGGTVPFAIVVDATRIYVLFPAR